MLHSVVKDEFKVSSGFWCGLVISVTVNQNYEKWGREILTTFIMMKERDERRSQVKHIQLHK